MSEKNLSAKQSSYPEKKSFGILAVVPYVLAVIWLSWIVIYVIYSSVLVAYPYDWEPGEASKILYAQRLTEHKPLYKSNDTFPMLGNCYPPLYPLLTAVLVKFAGPKLWCGRVVSIVSILLMMMLLYKIVVGKNKKWIWGLVAAGCFVMPSFVSNWYSLARMDALCSFFLLAMAYVVWKYPSSKWYAMVAALLAVCALFTKQTAVFCVAAVAMYYLFGKKWIQLILFCITGLVVGGICFFLCNYLSDGWFYRNLFADNTDRIFFMQRYASFFGALFLQYPWAWIIGIGSVSWSVCRRRCDIWLFYACGGLANALLIGANGSGPNYFFTLWSALSLFFADGLASLFVWFGKRSHTIRPVYAACIVFGVIAITCTNWLGGYGLFFRETLLSYMPDVQDKASMKRLESILRNEQGAVFVDRLPSLTLKYDKSGYYMEPALIQELYYAQKWDPRPLIKMIEDRKISLIYLFSRSLIPEPVKASVRKNYLLSDQIEIGTFEIWRKRVVQIYRRPPDNFHR